jgi:hypothetical protein
MFERVIAQTIQKITAETVQERSLIPLLDILQDERIPSRIKPFFETEVHWWLYNEMLARGANKRFDYDNPELASLINYLEQVQFRHARFEREEFVTVLDSAVKLIYNYLCRPQTTLKWYIFRGQPVKPLREVMLRFSAFVDYEYFRNVFIEWVDRKRAERPTFDAISATEFERVIRRTDDQILLNCTVEDLLDIMDPLFDFIGEGPQKSLPVDALIIFFDDKNIKKLVDQLEAYHKRGGESVTRDEFVTLLDELLSSAEEEPEVDYSAVYQNDELDEVVREHLMAGTRAVADIPDGEPHGGGDADNYPQGEIESGGPVDHLPQAYAGGYAAAEAPAQAHVSEWGAEVETAPMPRGDVVEEMVVEAVSEPVEDLEVATQNGFHAEPAMASAGEIALDAVDVDVEYLEESPFDADDDEILAPGSSGFDGESHEAAAAEPEIPIDFEWNDDDESSIVEIPAFDEARVEPVEETRGEPEGVLDADDHIADDHIDDDHVDDDHVDEDDDDEVYTPSAPPLDLTPEPVSQPSTIVVPQEPMIDVRRFIDAALERKVVKKIFAKDRASYEQTLDRINAAATWRAASQVLDELFVHRSVDPYSRTAIRFTDSVYGRYLRKG